VSTTTAWLSILVTCKSVRRKVWAAALLPLPLVIAVAALLAWQLAQVRETAHWVDHTDQVLAQIRLFERLKIDEETGFGACFLQGTAFSWSRIRLPLPGMQTASKRCSKGVSGSTDRYRFPSRIALAITARYWPIRLHGVPIVYHRVVGSRRSHSRFNWSCELRVPARVPVMPMRRLVPSRA